MVGIYITNLTAIPGTAGFTASATPLALALTVAVVAGLAIMLASALAGRRKRRSLPPPASAMRHRPARHAA